MFLARAGLDCTTRLYRPDMEQYRVSEYLQHRCVRVTTQDPQRDVDVECEVALANQLHEESFKSGDAVLTPCGTYNNYCCGQDDAARQCCTDGNTTLRAQVPAGDVITESSPGPSSSSSPSSTSNPSPPTSPTSQSSSSSTTASLQTTRNVLAGLTAAFGCAALVAAVLAIMAHRGARKEERQRVAAEQAKQALVNEKRVVDEVIVRLPGPFQQQFAYARRNAGLGAGT